MPEYQAILRRSDTYLNYYKFQMGHMILSNGVIIYHWETSIFHALNGLKMISYNFIVYVCHYVLLKYY